MGKGVDDHPEELRRKLALLGVSVDSLFGSL
jgi:hypothetical protein